MVNKEKLIASLEGELKTYEKSHAKTDPMDARQVVSWHTQCNMISWLRVHIDMLKNGGYD